MGIVKIPNPVKLICAITFSKDIILDSVFDSLERKFSEIDIKSTVFDFLHTQYYEKEMGKNLKKVYISFKELTSQESLPEIKIYTNMLEKQHSKKNKRKASKNAWLLKKF